MKETFPERFRKRAETFAGFDYDVIPKNALDVSDQERQATYEDLWNRGGFFPWIGTYQDILSSEEANDTAYAFWRDKVRARIKDPAIAEKLAPMKPFHPFGVKRPSLEQHYYEAYNQPNVQIVDLLRIPNRTSDGDGRQDEGQGSGSRHSRTGDGIDFLTGGLTSIDIRGTNGQTLREKWSSGSRAHLGMASALFPNLLYLRPAKPVRVLQRADLRRAAGRLGRRVPEHLREQPPPDQATPERRRPGAAVAELVGATVPAGAVLVHGRQHPRQEARDASLPRRAADVPAEVQQFADAGYAGFVLS